MRIPEENYRAGEINIVPLIDVIFCIMVVFIVASLALTRSAALDVKLPSATTAKQKLQPDVNISVTREGQIAVNREVVTLANLIPAVEGILAKTPSLDPNQPRLVVISADLSITHGKVVSVMDQLQQIPNLSLAIAAQRTSTAP